MKNIKKCLAMVFIVVFLFSSCSSESEKNYDELIESKSNIENEEESKSSMAEVKESSEEESILEKSEVKEIKNLSGALNIVSYDDYALIKIVADFVELYPDVEVTYTVKNNDEVVKLQKSNTLIEEKTKFVKQVTTQIMGGEDIDIVDISGMDRYKLAKSGYLTDLYSIIEEDNDLNLEDYYINIIKSLEYENKLYSFPVRFSFDMVANNPLVTDGLNLKYKNREISVPEILNTYTNSLKEGKIPAGTKAIFNYEYLRYNQKFQFIPYEFASFVDSKNEKSDFNSNLFKEYLNMTKLFPTQDSADVFYDMPGYNVAPGSSQDDYISNEFMYLLGFDDPYRYLEHNIMDYKTVGEIRMIKNSSGDFPFKIEKGNYAITEKSENKELAWEFVKFYVEEKENWKLKKSNQHLLPDIWWNMIERTIFPYQINKENNNSYLKVAFTLITKHTLYPVSEKVDFPKDSDEGLNMLSNELDNYIKKLNVEEFNNLNILYAVQDDLNDYYYNNLYTDEEIISILDNKVRLYFLE